MEKKGLPVYEYMKRVLKVGLYVVVLDIVSKASVYITKYWTSILVDIIVYALLPVAQNDPVSINSMPKTYAHDFALSILSYQRRFSFDIYHSQYA